MYTNYVDESLDEEVNEFLRQSEASRKAREKAKMELSREFNENLSEEIREKLRRASSSVIAECEEIQKKERERDQKTIKYIDEVLKNVKKPSHHVHWHPSIKDKKPAFFRSNIQKPMQLHNPSVSQDSKFTELPYIQSRKLRTKAMPESLPLVDYQVKEPNSVETARQRMRRVEEHLEGILDYELPSAENFKSMRHSLRNIQDKMSTHRLLLDRNTNCDVKIDSRNVTERIEEKYRELEDRMPCLSMSQRAQDEQKKGDQV